jgi:hypothetical protein
VGCPILEKYIKPKISENVQLTHVVVETVKISVNTEYCSSAGGEVISEFPFKTRCHM